MDSLNIEILELLEPIIQSAYKYVSSKIISYKFLSILKSKKILIFNKSINMNIYKLLYKSLIKTLIIPYYFELYKNNNFITIYKNSNIDLKDYNKYFTKKIYFKYYYNKNKMNVYTISKIIIFYNKKIYKNISLDINRDELEKIFILCIFYHTRSLQLFDILPPIIISLIDSITKLKNMNDILYHSIINSINNKYKTLYEYELLTILNIDNNELIKDLSDKKCEELSDETILAKIDILNQNNINSDATNILFSDNSKIDSDSNSIISDFSLSINDSNNFISVYDNNKVINNNIILLKNVYILNKKLTIIEKYYSNTNNIYDLIEKFLSYQNYTSNKKNNDLYNYIIEEIIIINKLNEKYQLAKTTKLNCSLKNIIKQFNLPNYNNLDPNTVKHFNIINNNFDVETEIKQINIKENPTLQPYPHGMNVQSNPVGFDSRTSYKVVQLNPVGFDSRTSYKVVQLNPHINPTIQLPIIPPRNINPSYIPPIIQSPIIPPRNINPSYIPPIIQHQPIDKYPNMPQKNPDQYFMQTPIQQNRQMDPIIKSPIIAPIIQHQPIDAIKSPNIQTSFCEYNQNETINQLSNITQRNINQSYNPVITCYHQNNKIKYQSPQYNYNEQSKIMTQIQDFGQINQMETLNNNIQLSHQNYRTNALMSPMLNKNKSLDSLLNNNSYQLTQINNFDNIFNQKKDISVIVNL